MSTAKSAGKKKNTEDTSSVKPTPQAIPQMDDKSKVRAVKEVTGWNADDITRVLEKYGFDTESTIEAILEGNKMLWCVIECVLRLFVGL